MKQQILFPGARKNIWRLSALLFLFVTAFTSSQAMADDCAALGGALIGGECQIAALQLKSNAACSGGGGCALDETLHILNTGSLIVTPLSAGLTVNILGDLIIDSPTGVRESGIFGDATTANGGGALISVVADNILLRGDGARGARISANQLAPSCVGGRGGTLSLSARNSVTTEPGSIISANAICSAGEINVRAALGPVHIGGRVASQSTLTGTGGKPRPGGGPIAIQAGCNLIIAETGIVSSKGRDPGANLVHLEGGCEVQIFGLVESTGPGHGVPQNPTNRCANASRPDKPANSTACIEVWAGKTLTIDSVFPRNGEMNADTAQAGGSQIAWIDLFANDAITVTGEDNGPFTIHANEFRHNPTGGMITLKSLHGTVTANKRAIQADATAAGGKGGKISIEAADEIIFDDAVLFARGHLRGAGTASAGGGIAIRSFTRSVRWQYGIGEVKPTGLTIPGVRQGRITLQQCLGGAVDLTGSVFPANGASTTPTILSNDCGGALTVPAYVILPTCACSPLVLRITAAPEECTFCDTDRFVPTSPNTDLAVSGEVCNSGMMSLFNISVTDTYCGALLPPATSLNPGDCMSFAQICTIPDAAFISQETTIQASGQNGAQTVTDQQTIMCINPCGYL